ncbi:hypothetical protein OXX69_004978 [Metschnikowia pulcherrima]
MTHLCPGNNNALSTPVFDVSAHSAPHTRWCSSLGACCTHTFSTMKRIYSHSPNHFPSSLYKRFSAMISLRSFRLPKLVVKLILPFVLALLVVVTVLYTTDVDTSIIDTKYMSIVSLLDSTKASLRPSKSGAIIAPQNVQLTFNPMKKGSPKEILAQNQKVYDAVLAQKIHEPKDFDIESIRPPKDPSDYVRENATIIALVRNNEIAGIKRTLRQFEQSFNAKFQYPYTFLNDEPFTETFKEKIRSFTQAEVEFVHIPAEIWNKPASIDRQREREAMEQLAKEDVAYAQKESYHNMCRFYSGNFQDLPALQKYKYYWRIEPNVRFYTNLNYDVFKYLAGTKKLYGFTINLYDIRQSVRTLLPETLSFLNKGENYKYVNKNGAFQWITENQQNPKIAEETGGYSTCHFWSNFEIADMDFYRSDAYSNWFKHLESTGKFYYERWGDAPVHSLGLALFADKSKLHWFRDIGYYHMPYTNCPNNDNTKGCNRGKFDDSGHNLDQNCMATWIDYEMENLGAIY